MVLHHLLCGKVEHRRNLYDARGVAVRTYQMLDVSQGAPRNLRPGDDRFNSNCNHVMAVFRFTPGLGRRWEDRHVEPMAFLVWLQFCDVHDFHDFHVWQPFIGDVWDADGRSVALQYKIFCGS